MSKQTEALAKGNNSKVVRIMRSKKLSLLGGCDYCGIFANTCVRARQPRENRYKNHRRDYRIGVNPDA